MARSPHTLMRTPEAILKVVVSARALCSYVGRGELSDTVYAACIEICVQKRKVSDGCIKCLLPRPRRPPLLQRARRQARVVGRTFLSECSRRTIQRDTFNLYASRNVSPDRRRYRSWVFTWSPSAARVCSNKLRSVHLDFGRRRCRSCRRCLGSAEAPPRAPLWSRASFSHRDCQWERRAASMRVCDAIEPY